MNHKLALVILGNVALGTCCAVLGHTGFPPLIVPLFVLFAVNVGAAMTNERG